MPSKKFLLIVSTLLFLSFVGFSYFVAKENFTQFDFDTTVKFQDRIPHRFDYPFSVLSLLGTAEITGIIWLTLTIILLIKRYFWGAVAMMSLPGALALEVYGKIFVYHPGPPFLFYRGVIDFDFPSHYVGVSYSYPSGHVLRTAFLVSFLSIFLWYKLPKKLQLFFQIPLLILLIIMMISRIYLGEHWFSDVVGGFLLGLSCGIATGVIATLKGLKPKYSTTL